MEESYSLVIAAKPRNIPLTRIQGSFVLLFGFLVLARLLHVFTPLFFLLNFLLLGLLFFCRLVVHFLEKVIATEVKTWTRMKDALLEHKQPESKFCPYIYKKNIPQPSCNFHAHAHTYTDYDNEAGPKLTVAKLAAKWEHHWWEIHLIDGP